ncbi:MAG: hypothetical protein AAF567_07810 [Actinomycetota bacterium]
MRTSQAFSGHLDQAYGEVRTQFLNWTRLGFADDRTPVLEEYFHSTRVGDTRRVGDASVLADRRRPDANRTVLVLGSHDTHTLTQTDAAASDQSELRGAGTGRLIGSTIACLEGFKASPAAADLSLMALSVGPGDEALDLIQRYGPSHPDVIVMTDAVSWSQDPPAITTGSRGRIEATITITAGSPVNDTAYAGASLNPLNRLVEVIADLRDQRGRISLPGFYDRAHRPDRSSLAGLVDATWPERLGVGAPTGTISPIERATQWPVVNLLGIDSAGPNGSTPGSATARLAIYLVADQRPVEVERALRTWLTQAVPAPLTSALRVDSSARPYRSDVEGPAGIAQRRAVERVTGTDPVLVPGGGAIGAGEIHFTTGVPVLFAGIIGPNQRWGTTAETLDMRLLDQGTAVASELFVQLARTLPPRGE